MKKYSLLVLGILLAVSCVQKQIPQSQTLQVTNAARIVFTNKKAFCVETPNGGPIAYYLCFASNVPPNKKFHLQSTDEVNPSYSPLELVSDDQGHLYLATDKSVRLDEYLLCMTWRHYGELCHLWLVSDDKKIAVRTTCIPYPLEAFGSDGAHLALERLTPNGSLVRCEGRHFLPGEKLTLLSSTKTRMSEEPIVTFNGSFFIEIKPPDQKSYGDMVTLQLKRQNGEYLTLTYPWGRETSNKNLFAGNFSKFKDEDYEKLDEAYNAYRLKLLGVSELS